jgi:hypothetical protein
LEKLCVVDKVLEDTVNAAYDNTQPDSSKISGEVSINSQPDFIEKLKLGIDNMDIEKMKIEFEYQIEKLKNIFGSYKTNE